MPKNTEYIKYTKKYKMQKQTIGVEWHKEAADQSSQIAKDKNTENTTNTKCKMQTLDR